MKRKLNIAMVCDPIDYTAGSIVSTLRFSERLAARGHKIIFIAAKTPYASGDVNGIKTYRFRSVLVPKTENKFYLALPTIAEAKKILKKEKIDLIHIIIPFGANFSFIKAAKSLGIKIVMHSHTQAENVFLHIPKILGREELSALFSDYLARMYRNADALVYPTEFAREKSPKMDASMKYEVISNGVDTSIFKPESPAPFFKKYHISPKDKHIVFVGRLHPEKSIDTLIKAVPEIVKKQPNVRVLIVGDGHQREELEALSKSLHLEEKVFFLGKISGEDLILTYNACDIFCLPSLAELEGMVVLEAMACGAPILIADAPDSASKYFVDRNGFLFKPQDSHDCAKEALAMLGDEKALKVMGRQSLKNSKLYDINRSVERLEALYYSILPEV
jgi:phosphatidylinositol alpha 1,6-mannosyltransferase